MTKKKIMLYSIENNDNINYYVFDKSQEAIEILAKILIYFGVEFDFEEKYKTKEGKIKVRKINFTKYYDVVHNFTSHQYQDFEGKIFYGKKRMFVIINCSQKLRLEFNKALSKVSKMPKPKTYKKSK